VVNVGKAVCVYRSLYEMWRCIGEELCGLFADALRSVVPDIKCADDSYGDIMLDSDARSAFVMLEHNGEIVSIEDVIKKVFPELRGYEGIMCDVFFTEEEAEKAVQVLERIRNEEFDRVIAKCVERAGNVL